MGEIIFKEKDIRMAKRLSGALQHQVRQTVSLYADVPTINYDRLAVVFKKSILMVIKNSFHKYIMAHKGVTMEQAKEEWDRFRKILERNL